MSGTSCLLLTYFLISITNGFSQPLTCSSNEEERCVTVCPPELTCKTRDIKFSCKLDSKPCEKKCVCKENYFRNALGECISAEQCDKCCGAHEFFSCGPECDNECKNIATQNRTNCPIVNIQCNQKCYCEDGFARDARGECIPVEKCPKTNQCGKNENYECKKSCPPETCTSLVARYKCDSKETCKYGCYCKPGFLREKANSPCIPICKCNVMKNSPDCQT